MDMDGARGAPFATGDVMDLQHYLLLLVGSVLVNNVVLVRILGLCPFMGVSKKLEASLGMGIATTFVLTLACGTSWLLDQLLILWQLEYLRTLGFIVVTEIGYSK